MVIPPGRAYLDPGDRLTGRYDPPRRCAVVTQWGPGGGPRNVLVRYDDGHQAVVPFSRRLRRAPDDAPARREARARKVARLYASGLSVRQAAAKAGIHHQTALDDLARLDRYTFGDYRRRLDKRHQAARDKRMDAAARLRGDGKSLRQIAAELDVSHETIRGDLARWNAAHPNVVPLSQRRQEMAAQTRPGGGKITRQKLTPQVGGE